MFKLFTPPQTTPHNGIARSTGSLWYPVALTLTTGTAIVVVLLPVLLAMLGATSGGGTFDPYSHVIKASAFVAYTLIWLSMLAGLSITGKVGRKWPGRPPQWAMASRFGLHRYLSLLGLGFASVHALALLGDRYMGYTLAQALVPFMAGSYKPHWLGLGQIALYALAVVAFSFYFRDRLGVRSWRLIHSLSFALFLMALIHAVQSGSDSSSWWASGLYWVSAASVLLGSIYRVLVARRGRPKESVAATGLIALSSSHISTT